MGRQDLTTRSQVTLTLDKEVLDFIRKYSKETDIPISRYIDRLVRQEMEKYSKKDAD